MPILKQCLIGKVLFLDQQMPRHLQRRRNMTANKLYAKSTLFFPPSSSKVLTGMWMFIGCLNIFAKNGWLPTGNAGWNWHVSSHRRQRNCCIQIEFKYCQMLYASLIWSKLRTDSKSTKQGCVWLLLSTTTEHDH